jgi:hypothetical protein
MNVAAFWLQVENRHDFLSRGNCSLVPPVLQWAVLIRINSPRRNDQETDQMSYKADVPHNDFAAGFEAGFRAIKGNDERLLILTLAPQIAVFGLTHFLLGVRAGLERAGVELDEF